MKPATVIGLSLIGVAAYLMLRQQMKDGALRPGTFNPASPENVVYRNIPHSEGGSFGSDLYDWVNRIIPSDAYRAAIDIEKPTN